MCEVLTALELALAKLYTFHKARFFFQITRNRLLRQHVFRLSPVTGEPGQLRKLVGIEVNFHCLRVGADKSAVVKRRLFHPVFTSAILSYSVSCDAALLTAIVSPTSPTLKRAKRFTEMFSPSLPMTLAMSCETVMVWSLMKGCS
jgi:hypothetical protein